MKKYATRLKMVPFLICLLALIIISGCETAKGVVRDVKNADQWIRDNAW